MALRASLLALLAVLAWSANAFAVTPSPNISTVAGGGSGSGGAATDQVLTDPMSVTASPQPVPYTSDGFGLIDGCAARWVAPSAGSDTGAISTQLGVIDNCAKGQSYAFSDQLIGDTLGGSAHPCCVAGAAPNLLVGNSGSGKVEHTDGVAVDTLAGSGSLDCGTPNDVAATSAGLCFIAALAQRPDTMGQWYPTFLFTSGLLNSPNEVYELRDVGGGVMKVFALFNNVPMFGLTYTPDGGYIVSAVNSTITKLSSTDAATATSSVIAGSIQSPGFAGDGGPASGARFHYAAGLALSYDGGYFIADSGNCRIRKVDGFSSTDTIHTIAGNGCSGDPLGDGGPATDANIGNPQSIAISPRGLLIADPTFDRIRLVNRTSILTGPTGLTASATPAFTFASLDTPAHFKCTLDDGAPFDCPSPFTLPAAPDGQHTLAVWENGPPADPTPDKRTFTIDTTPPAPFALDAPAADAAGVAPTPTFSWDATQDATSAVDHYELWLDGAKARDVAPTACSGTKCAAAPPAALGEGDHTWQIKAVDQAGNVRSSEIRRLSDGTAPTASLVVSPNPALVGRSVNFDASGSTDTHGPIARYEWDLDGNGTFETDGGSSPTTTRSYGAPATIPVSVRVTDGAGKTSTATASLRISDASGSQSLLGVSIDNGAQYTRDPNVTLTVKAPANANAFLVSNDGGFFAPATFPAASTIKWKLDSSGPERLPKTVYLRFMLGPIVSDNYTDDIILDEIPPVVQSAALVPPAGGGKAASAAALKTYVVKVKAKDSNSGVGKVQVAANKKRPGKLIAYKEKLSVKLAAKPQFIRAQDRAGNFSAWKKLR